MQIRMKEVITTTSPNLEDKCECNGTGWIETSEGTYKKCECVEIDYVKKLWQHFGANPGEVKKISEYVPFDEVTKQAKERAIKYVNDFNLIKSTRENSFGLFGQAGAGKSHIVIAIGAALLNRKEHVKTVYMPYLEAIQELKSNAIDDEYYRKIQKRYLNAELLIIDDLFKDKMRNGSLIRGAMITEADMKHIYPIINHRYLNLMPTVFSTECTPKILVHLDEALAGRIIESCSKNMVVFKGIKYNYRMRNLVKGE